MMTELGSGRHVIGDGCKGPKRGTRPVADLLQRAADCFGVLRLYVDEGLDAILTTSPEDPDEALVVSLDGELGVLGEDLREQTTREVRENELGLLGAVIVDLVDHGRHVRVIVTLGEDLIDPLANSAQDATDTDLLRLLPEGTLHFSFAHVSSVTWGHY